jgi:hypothetical protein
MLCESWHARHHIELGLLWAIAGSAPTTLHWRRSDPSPFVSPLHSHNPSCSPPPSPFLGDGGSQENQRFELAGTRRGLAPGRVRSGVAGVIEAQNRSPLLLAGLPRGAHPDGGAAGLETGDPASRSAEIASLSSGSARGGRC